MIQFKYVKFRNILSSGDNWTRIDLDKTSSTLIVGENGAGKCLRGSTEVDVKTEDDETMKKLNDFMNNT